MSKPAFHQKENDQRKGERYFSIFPHSQMPSLSSSKGSAVVNCLQVIIYNQGETHQN
jgi:hypothetical protein